MLGIVALGLSAACGPAPGAGLVLEHPSPVPRREKAGPIPDPATSGPLGLDPLLRYAQARSPLLHVSRQRVRLGDAEVEGAEVLVPYNPSLRLNAGGRRVAGVTRFEMGAQLQQRLEVAGERGTRLEAAEAGREARRAEVEVARWELHVRVHALFYKLLVRRQRLKAAAALERFAGDVGEIIEQRIEAGEDAPLKTLAARTELAKAAQLAIEAKRAYREAQLHLARLSGWPAGVPIEVEGRLSKKRGIPKREVLRQRALASHPSRRWLALEVEASEARVEREDREGTLEPTFGVRYGREAEPEAAAHVIVGTVRIPIPIWQRNQAGRARARAELGVSRAAAYAFTSTLDARLAEAIVRVEAAEARTEVFGGELLPAFARNLGKLQRAFELGEIDILQLAQIQSRLLVTQDAALVALEDYYDALAELEGLSGVELLGGS